MNKVTRAGGEKLNAPRKTRDHYNLIQKLLESNIQIVVDPEELIMSLNLVESGSHQSGHKGK